MLKGLRQRAFTLVEMLVTVALLALLLALAAPSFSVLLANAQIRTASQALFDGLQLARVEAIRRNTRVVFNLTSGSGWLVALESDGSTVQSRPAGEGSASVLLTVAPAGATRATFDGLGRLQPNADGTGTIAQLDADVLIGTGSTHPLRVLLSNGGAARLCDPAAPAGGATAC
jgi:type IV fimbrial biogenesis protein FimT